MRRHRQIALLGYPGVGKSSLAHHFVYKQFSDVYDPNIKTSKRKKIFLRKKKENFSFRSSTSIQYWR
jgi:GTPase SAR1 family protein